MSGKIRSKAGIILAIVLMLLAFLQAGLIGAGLARHPPASAYDWGYLTGRVLVFVLLAYAARHIYRRSLSRDNED